ncbi:hypothetical protein, partial [Isoptericola hypogeus]|uniref:hypothetical protein n=1 Tax=Isoptericola hypogeus TaxID=300179 RepID=UPI0031D0B6BC
MDTRQLAPGSVVVNVFPESDPALELRPGGEMFDLGGEEPLVDRSLAEFERLVNEINESSSGDDPEFVRHMRALGPRVANAVRVLAEDIGESGFDMDVDWRPPRQPSRHVAINPTSAGFIQSLVERQRLEAEPFIVDGELHTASDRSSPWEVDTVEHGMIRVKHDQISADDTRGLAVGMRVRL